MQKIKDFIINNNLTFEEGSRNSDSVILAGYALYLRQNDIEWDVDDLINIITDTIGYTNTFETEFVRVFEFAKRNNYNNWWNHESNRKMYKL